MLGADARAARARQGRRHVPRRRDPPAGRVQLHAARRGAPRAARRRGGAGPARASTAPTSAGSGPSRRSSSASSSWSTSTTTTTTRASGRSTWSSPTPPRPPRSSATCSRALGVALTPEIAEALYIGLVTDTGRFQYANTTPKALRLAAELVEAGADVHGVFRQVYETVQFAKLKLLARALEHAQVYEGGPGRHLVPPPLGLRRGRRRGAVLGGDHRLPAPERGRPSSWR